MAGCWMCYALTDTFRIFDVTTYALCLFSGREVQVNSETNLFIGIVKPPVTTNRAFN